MGVGILMIFSAIFAGYLVYRMPDDGVYLPPPTGLTPEEEEELRRKLNLPPGSTIPAPPSPGTSASSAPASSANKSESDIMDMMRLNSAGSVKK